jgi:ribosomal protein L11 methyltransferase
MKTWPALEVRVGPDSEPLQVALADYDVAAIDDNAADLWRVFFHTPAERDRARGDLVAFAAAPVEIEDEDWAARSQASLRAVRVGRLVVAPPWDCPAARAETRTIVIQPSTGFGTGHHATTRLCLEALQRLDIRRRSVLDVGTGSGVLAIAARMLGAAPVIALDDDADAVQAARDNVARNAGVEVAIHVGDLRTAELPRFDVVLANLTAGLLISAAARLRAVTAAGGHLVVSGFTVSEEAEVRAALERSPESVDAGSSHAFRASEDGWGCFVLQVPSRT